MTLDAREIGDRIRRLRLVSGLGQVEFASRVGIANGSVSKLENGRMATTASLLDTIAQVLDCTPSFLRSTRQSVLTSRPWLRAYADAPKRVVDRQLSECTLAAEVIETLQLKAIPDALPTFDGDPSDDDAIEQFALDVRAVAQLSEDDVVGNMVRAAERVGCLVLPMREELGRHLGLSLRVDLTPVICASRPSHDSRRQIPGDRQRFTVAHELGHLTLHSNLPPPQTAADAAQVERQAHLFAAAFLAPGDAMLDELAARGGRVTLRTLAAIKQQWGIAIKALVMRFRSLGVIDAEQARSLYKQISARGWSRTEPVPVGNEEAIWLRRALQKRFSAGPDALTAAAGACGLGRAHIARWVDWSPTANMPDDEAEVFELHSPQSQPADRASDHLGTVRSLPARRR